jgi:hypothetical protein
MMRGDATRLICARVLGLAMELQKVRGEVQTIPLSVHNHDILAPTTQSSFLLFTTMRIL